MRTFTVDAHPGEVTAMLTERGIQPAYCEWDDGACVTEFAVHGDASTKAVVLDLARRGWRWWRGHARSQYADPTFAQASQRILRRGRG